MAKSKVAPAMPAQREMYPRVDIDRSVAAEASRRNIEIIVWYKRLINATLGLLVASIMFTLVAVLFAAIQPMPALYGTALDGALRPISYVRDSKDPRLEELRASLVSEQMSRKELAKSQISTSPAALASVAGAAKSPPAPAPAISTPAPVAK